MVAEGILIQAYKQLSEDERGRWVRRAAADELRVEFLSEIRQLREGSGGDDNGSDEEGDDDE